MERNEKPSQRKLRRARERGEAPYSGELTSSLILVVGILLLPLFRERFVTLFKKSFSELNQWQPLEGLAALFQLFVWPVVLFLGVLFGITLLSNWLQRGWVWKRASKKGGARLLPPLIKLLVIGTVGYLSLRKVAEVNLYSLLLKVAVALFIYGVCDYFYQRWRFNRRMQTTKQEAKEERRAEEGDRDTKNRMK